MYLDVKKLCMLFAIMYIILFLWNNYKGARKQIALYSHYLCSLDVLLYLVGKLHWKEWGKKNKNISKGWLHVSLLVMIHRSVRWLWTLVTAGNEAERCLCTVTQYSLDALRCPECRIHPHTPTGPPTTNHFFSILFKAQENISSYVHHATYQRIFWHIVKQW